MEDLTPVVKEMARKWLLSDNIKPQAAHWKKEYYYYLKKFIYSHNNELKSTMENELCAYFNDVFKWKTLVHKAENIGIYLDNKLQ